MKGNDLPNLIFALSAALLLFTAAGALPVRAFLIDTVSHFMLQYLIGGVILLAAAMLARSLPAAGMAALALCIAMWQVGPLAKFGAAAPQDFKTPPKTITVLQANTLYSNRQVDGLIAAIDRFDPDLILIQEANSAISAYFRDVMRQYPHQDLDVSDTHAFGQAVASKLQIENVERHHFAGKKKGGQSFTVNVGEKSLAILSAHACNPLSCHAIRDTELDAIGKWAADQSGNVAIFGDLNVTPYARAFKDTLTTGGLTDARKGRGVMGTYPSQLPAFMRIPIDHTLTKGDVRVLSMQVLNHANSGSDHLAVVTTLAIGE